MKRLITARDVVRREVMFSQVCVSLGEGEGWVPWPGPGQGTPILLPPCPPQPGPGQGIPMSSPNPSHLARTRTGYPHFLAGNATDRIRHGRYAYCVFTKENFLVYILYWLHRNTQISGIKIWSQLRVTYKIRNGHTRQQPQLHTMLNKTQSRNR